MKKKLLLLLTCACLLAALAACGGSGTKNDNKDDVNSADNLIGTWKLTSAEYAGQKVADDQLDAYGYQFTFDKDGNANIEISGVSYDTTYTFKDSTVTFDEEALSAMTLKLSGSALVYEEPTTQVKFNFSK